MDPPREFVVGVDRDIRIRHCADIELNPDEQVTFRAGAGHEYDVVRKDWGFYATPSLNGRLADHGFRAGLVANASGRLFLLLAERSREAAFERYLEREAQELVAWLDTDGAVGSLRQALASMDTEVGPVGGFACPLCGSRDADEVFAYHASPAGETRFVLPAGMQYRRCIVRCRLCGLYANLHTIPLADLYREGYVDATYDGAEGIARAFERIMSLPPERSDNYQRVQRVASFMGERLQRAGRDTAGTVLDIGAGLCVFLARMKDRGWKGTALDPDPRAAAFARDAVGVDAVCADFFEYEPSGRFDLVTLNKVLEHVEDPTAMLELCRRQLADDGLVYVELPDGEAAAAEGADREEFFIEHWWAFDASSLSILAKRAGFRVELLERVHEPSTKYTLRAFLAPT